MIIQTRTSAGIKGNIHFSRLFHFIIPVDSFVLHSLGIVPVSPCRSPTRAVFIPSPPLESFSSGQELKKFLGIFSLLLAISESVGVCAYVYVHDGNLLFLSNGDLQQYGVIELIGYLKGSWEVSSKRDRDSDRDRESQHFRELVFTVRSCERKKDKTLQKYKRNTTSVNMIAAYKDMKLFSLLGPSISCSGALALRKLMQLQAYLQRFPYESCSDAPQYEL
uniref:Uncharacterized protein n=1 Tax=Glossina pallidipes TaxID=7398 RepID=A0A1A9Z949_GLOPL